MWLGGPGLLGASSKTLSSESPVQESDSPEAHRDRVLARMCFTSKGEARHGELLQGDERVQPLLTRTRQKPPSGSEDPAQPKQTEKAKPPLALNCLRLCLIRPIKGTDHIPSFLGPAVLL
ncbi:hypothetical protein R6Z07F_003553 [Ovis aries]